MISLSKASNLNNILPTNNERKVIVSPEAHPELLGYLETKAYEIETVKALDEVSSLVASHPDVLFCKLGSTDCSPVYNGDSSLLSVNYPGDSIYNAVCTGKYFIHKLSITDKDLLVAARKLNPHLQFINVRQGYTKCSTVVVNENAIITYDKGIARPCRKAGMEVLLTEPGHIKLTGAQSGFIGGTSGRVGNEIIFNGNLSAHPNFKEIYNFIDNNNLRCKWFSSYPLQDIGSIISCH